jgi:hypothetical protein
MLKIREETFKHYLFFMEERMNIFWKRFEEPNFFFGNLTSDPIFAEYKFTNVYRVCDRVTQYLLRNVIYKSGDSFSPEDTVLRVLLFKIFNKIETWEYIESELGAIRIETFDRPLLSEILTKRIKETPIFSAAYMMTGSHHKYDDGNSYKHEKWLQMLDEEILKGSGLEKIVQSNSLAELFNHLSRCSFIGPFLAYQYAIDLNYSEVVNFDENSFVKAGIGAIRGVKKCFEDLGNKSFEDAIKFTADNIEGFRAKFGCNFKPLFGREPTLIDLQNCFCETDKYLRVKMPELSMGNKRIKQKFKINPQKIDYFFPPKWYLKNVL